MMLLEALRSAFAHRVRAGLTVLGIVIGAGSIVLLASLLHGGRAFLVHANQEASDDDVIEVHGEEPPPAQRERTTRPLSRGDVTAMQGALGGALVEPESSVDTIARLDGRKKRVAMVSAGPGTLALYRLEIESGRALDDEDRRLGSRVAVIGHEIYEELARRAPLGGLRLEIGGRLFAVVGVLAKKPMIGNTDSTYLWDRKVLIPPATYDALYAPSHEVNRIFVRRAPSPSAARGVMRGILDRRHLGVVNFEFAKDESGGMEKLILDVISILLLGSGLLALVASGINIMNVMLVTVTERTREIGLRRAIGATPRSILVQFLLEALVLSLVGAGLGIGFGALAGVGLAALARQALGFWALAVPAWSIALGLGLSVVTGLVFGLLPAWRAARVSPIEALRSD